MSRQEFVVFVVLIVIFLVIAIGMSVDIALTHSRAKSEELKEREEDQQRMRELAHLIAYASSNAPVDEDDARFYTGLQTEYDAIRKAYYGIDE